MGADEDRVVKAEMGGTGYQPVFGGNLSPNGDRLAGYCNRSRFSQPVLTPLRW